MQSYIGCTMFEAEKMTLGEYNDFRQWLTPSDENPDDEGYLLHYEDGYKTWSPKERFEKIYLKLTDPTKITHDLLFCIDSLVSGLEVRRDGNHTD